MTRRFYITSLTRNRSPIRRFLTRVVNAATDLVTLHVLDYDLVQPVRIVDRIPMDDATTQQLVSWHWPPRV